MYFPYKQTDCSVRLNKGPRPGLLAPELLPRLCPSEPTCCPHCSSQGGPTQLWGLCLRSAALSLFSFKPLSLCSPSSLCLLLDVFYSGPHPVTPNFPHQLSQPIGSVSHGVPKRPLEASCVRPHPPQILPREPSCQRACPMSLLPPNLCSGCCPS